MKRIRSLITVAILALMSLAPKLTLAQVAPGPLPFNFNATQTLVEDALRQLQPNKAQKVTPSNTPSAPLGTDKKPSIRPFIPFFEDDEDTSEYENSVETEEPYIEISTEPPNE
jgi:hypothetical protein